MWLVNVGESEFEFEDVELAAAYVAGEAELGLEEARQLFAFEAVGASVEARGVRVTKVA